MNRKTKLKILGIIVILFISAILFVIVKPVNIGKIKDIEVNYGKNANLSVDVSIPVENPNFLTYKVKSVNLDIAINKNKIGKIQEFSEITITPFSEQNYPLTAKISFGNMLLGAFSVMKSLSDNQADVTVTGTVEVESLFISKTIEVNHNQKIKLINP